MEKLISGINKLTPMVAKAMSGGSNHATSHHLFILKEIPNGFNGSW